MIRRVLESLSDHRAAALWGGAAGLLLLIAVGFAWRNLNGTDDKPLPDRPLKAEVKRAISGHKIRLETDERVRYAGIRTPHGLLQYDDMSSFEVPS